MNRVVVGAAFAVVLLGSFGTISLAIAAPSGPVTMKPLGPGTVPPSGAVVPKYALSCHTSGGEFPQLTLKNVGSESIGPTIGITVKFATAPQIGLNLPNTLAPGKEVNLPLQDDNKGKPRGACTVMIFGVK